MSMFDDEAGFVGSFADDDDFQDPGPRMWQEAADKDCWLTADGALLRIADMSYAHVRNALLFLARNDVPLHPGLEAAYKKRTHSQFLDDYPEYK